MKFHDRLAAFRQEYKGIYIATSDPDSTRVLAKAHDYQTLENILRQKKLTTKSVAIQYLEPKQAICAYGVSLS